MKKVVTVLGVLVLLLIGPRVNPAQGGHIMCGDTVGPGKVQLDGNVGPCAGNGITVVSNTKVDGNGFGIVGSRASGSIGIDLTGSTRVGVNNVAVQHFDVGIRINNSSDGKNKIKTSRVSSNNLGISVSTSNENEIEDNLGFENVTCILVSAASENEVQSNACVHSGAVGIQLDGAVDNEIENNHVSGGSSGIALHNGSTHNKVKRNQITYISAPAGDLSADGTSIGNTYSDNVCDIASGEPEEVGACKAPNTEEPALAE